MLVKDSGVKWWVLVINSLSVFTVLYNTTAIMNAIPAVQQAFDLSPEMLQWVINGYVLAAASLIILAVRLGEKYGHFYLLFIGTLFFVFSSLMIALTNSEFGLLLFRVVQGASASFVTPLTLSSLPIVFPEKSKGMAVVVWGGMIGLGSGFGPLIGGLLTESLSWRFIFWLNIPLMGVAAVGYLFFMFYYTYEHKKGRIDCWGFLLLVAWLIPLFLVLISGSKWGWLSSLTLSLEVVVVLAFLAFIYVEKVLGEPLINLSFFAIPGFVMSAVGMMLSTAAFLLFLYLFSIFFQWPLIFNYSPITAGLVMLPANLCMFVGALFAAPAAEKVGFKRVLLVGMLLLFVAYAWLSFFDVGMGYGRLWYKIVLLGLGFGLTFPVCPHLGLHFVAPKDGGQASGMITTFNYIGITLTIAIASIVYVQFSEHAVERDLPHLSKEERVEIARLTLSSTQHIDQILARYPSDRKNITHALTEGAVYGFRMSMWYGALIGLIGFILAWGLLKFKRWGGMGRIVD